MTDEMMSLCALLEKSSDVDLLREMVGFAAQRLMELEVESLTGAAHGERTPERRRPRRRRSRLARSGRGMDRLTHISTLNARDCWAGPPETLHPGRRPVPQPTP
jgi:hypothetical protein